MSIGIGDALGKSFGFAFDSTFKHIGRWIGMAVLLCIPIVNWIVMGMFLKVYRNEEPDFSNAGKSFVQGLLALIISIIYFLIPFILAMILGVAALLPAIFSGASDIGTAITGGLGIVSTIIIVVVSIIFYLIFTPAMINFARKGFGAAFAFGDIFAMIGKLGWGKYILAILLLFVVFIILGIVLGLIMLIPIIGLIIFILALPILYLIQYKYWGALFE